MPCYKCSNNKWKYGRSGDCVFNSESHCREAEQAIHAKPKAKVENPRKPKPTKN